MKILHVSPTYLPAVRYGGPIYSVHALCKALANCGHEVDVYTTNVDGDQDSMVPLEKPVAVDNVNVWYFRSRIGRRLYFSPSMMHHLAETISSFDVVHLHSVFLWPTWAAARVARRAKVPYLISPRGMLVQELIQRKSRFLKSIWISLIERKNLENAAAIHVTSSKENDALCNFSFKLPPVFIIPNGVSVPTEYTEEIRNDVRLATDHSPFVLFLGRINWKKGLDRLIKSWVKIPGTRLVIAGNDEENYLPTLQALAKEIGVEKQIIFVARGVTGADKEALFRAANLFVLPSYSENFGNTVLEAMIRGLPVVVTEEVGAGSIVRDSGAGRVVSAERLGDVIAGMLTDNDKLKNMALLGKKWALKYYDWEQIANEMIKRYKVVLEETLD